MTLPFYAVLFVALKRAIFNSLEYKEPLEVEVIVFQFSQKLVDVSVHVPLVDDGQPAPESLAKNTEKSASLCKIYQVSGGEILSDQNPQLARKI